MSDTRRASKFLSLILRHQPEKIGIALDRCGWAEVWDITANGPEWLTEELIFESVEKNDKKRFELAKEPTLRIRARQGHSIDVNLELVSQSPPVTLFHGTYAKAVPSIKESGLLKMKRHHVHMSESNEDAVAVGRRSGAPILLTIKSSEMFHQGFEFFRTENGVWLTENVPHNISSSHEWN